MAKLSVDKALLNAKSLAKKGDIAEAQKLYQAVLQAFPQNKRAQQGLASLNKTKQPNPNVGSSPDQLAKRFPQFCFNHLPELWWYDGEKDHRGISPEPEDILMERANSFVDYLRKENVHSTAIVSHGNFIRAVTGIKPQNCEVIAFNPYQS